jgi:AbrB family looped-hinge helix DNA binding protein
MAKQQCCDASPGFHVDAVISVDERGQMVLPKDVRERAGIQPGDKLALITWQKDGAVCCVSLVKTTALADMVKGLLGPMAQELAAKR